MKAGFAYSGKAYELETSIFNAISLYTTDVDSKMNAFCIEVAKISVIYRENISVHKKNLLLLLNSGEKKALEHLEEIFNLFAKSQFMPYIARHGITEENLKDPKFVNFKNDVAETFPKVIEQLKNLRDLLREERYALALHSILLNC